MKSGIRSTGLARYRAIAPSATFAVSGTSRSPSRDAIIRASRGRTSNRSFMADPARPSGRSPARARGNPARGAFAARGRSVSREALGEDLGDVPGLDLVGDLLRLHAVLEHREAEGTGRGQDVGIHLHRLLDAQLVHAAPLALLHPDAAAPTAAAE